MKRFLLFVSLFGLALALPLEEDDLINDDDIRSILDTISPEARVAFGNKTCSCGKRNAATRIVGGTVALKNEFPWRTTMYTTTSRHFCAGTIISRNWVLTAAHCTAAVRGQTLYANVGDHDTSTREETKSQLIRCSQVIQHERYNPRTYDNDIALCKLATRLTYSRSVQPACLPWTMASWTFKNRNVVASGWGTTSSGGRASTVLRKVNLPIKTTEECREYHGRSAITDNMICTYSAGKDTCQGDSGGSIDFLDTSTDRYFAIGVVSWGIGCAARNRPGVYAKVGNYLDWIRSKTNSESFCR